MHCLTTTRDSVLAGLEQQLEQEAAKAAAAAQAASAPAATGPVQAQAAAPAAPAAPGVLTGAAPAASAGQSAATTAAAGQAPSAQASKETAAQQAFLAEYKPLIARDFFKQPDGTYPCTTVKDLYLRLRKWQAAVRRQLTRPSFPRQLESLSRPLSESKGQQMEVPGQYMSLREPTPDQHVKVDRVLPDVELVERNGACHRRITIRGNDGKLYPFIVEATGSTIGMGDERTLQLCQLMNTCMEKEKQARRRHMTLHVRPIVGLAPRCRLVADDITNVSLYDILHEFLAERGMTPDSVAIRYQEKAALLARSTTDPAMAAMNEIADLVPDTVRLVQTENGSLLHLVTWMIK